MLILAALGLCVASPSQGLAGKRVALVVGINAYQELPLLQKAVSDARAVHNVLVSDLGFDAADVELLEDGSDSDIVTAWKRALARVEKDGLLFFFFAGHGIEVEGRNYLIPRNAALNRADQSSLRIGSIDLQRMLAELGAAQDRAPNLVGVFVLDACRNNPFTHREGASAGLAPIRVLPKQVFIMYSAGVGQKALDGRGDNSVYTTKLLPLLREQKGGTLALADLAQRLRRGVYIEASRFFDPTTGRPYQQTPAYYDQLMSRQTLLAVSVNEPERFEKTAATDPPLPTRGLARGDILFECEHCPELVVVEPGKFEMGSPSNEAGRSSNEGEKPRPVEIPKALAFGKFEVTNREWNACVKLGHCKGEREGSARDPVTYVSWKDAQTYVGWLRDSTKQPYRLPTEAEWEYAARAGSPDRTFFKPDEKTSMCDFANGADRSMASLFWASACSDEVGRQVAPIGSYKANPFGLHDVYGNVWEWVEDCYASGYAGAPSDGTALQPSGACSRRSVRGGSWRSGPSALRSASRNAFSEDHSRATLGFRVVKDLQ